MSTPPAPAGKLPVHVLTGFLGAGKTSLLRRLLASPALADTAVLINEFGEVGLDHLLVETVDEDVVLLKSGCVCCTVRTDLKDGLVQLMERRRNGSLPAFGRVVLETTGIADPGPIVATLTADPMLRHQFRLGGIVTVVDVPNGASNLAAFPESLRQVAAADRLAISKGDLATAAETAALEAHLEALNPSAARIALRPDEEPDSALLLGDPADDAHRAAEVRRWIASARERQSGWRFHGHAAHEAGRHGDIRTFVIRAEAPLAWPRFALWLSMLLNRHGGEILRLKGLLSIENVAEPVVIQGVQHLVHAPEHLKAWPDGVSGTQIVMIARGLDPALVQRSFDAFTGAGLAQ